ncbi:helix-turn-helix domain-containing protein [Cupriavidus sp. SIMBA_020]|uniref:helix-turn-helix domain-containing protein n=1 Tax=Cupriavidus sp. SIMBA_020 TaxID=3085766 RepID=UPI003978752B
MKSNTEIAAAILRSASIWKAARRLAPVMQVRQIMHEKGLKNVDLAERLGVSEANISKLLKGDKNLQLDTLYLLADAIGEELALSYGQDNAQAEDKDHEDCNDQPSQSAFSEWTEISVEDETVEAAPACAGAVIHLDTFRNLRNVLSRQSIAEDRFSGQDFINESRAAYA